MSTGGLRALARNVRLPLLAAAAALVLWEGATRLFAIPQFLLPAPSTILAAIADEPSLYVFHAVYTLQATLAGFVLAVVLGVACAVLIVQFKAMEQTLYTFLVSLNSVPKVAIAPLFIVWMGTGLNPKIAIAAMIAVFAIVIDMVHGLKSVDAEMLDLGRSARASALQMIWKIRFPHALPALFAGMKVAISLALIGAIVGEFVAANRGLGYLILMAQGQFDMVRMFAALAILSCIGLALFYGVALAERLILPWQTAQRKALAIRGH
ncbi:ABC transporter permease [Xanthobacter sp. VNH20]|uniref:ABC transporter permease n=1 Tax=Xanthobacter sp. VNH20 TaxID=3156616 RepID=UPI0032B4744F